MLTHSTFLAGDRGQGKLSDLYTAELAGIPTPELLGVGYTSEEWMSMSPSLANSSFVVKPDIGKGLCAAVDVSRQCQCSVHAWAIRSLGECRALLCSEWRFVCQGPLPGGCVWCEVQSIAT